jgi:hypothetical protein
MSTSNIKLNPDRIRNRKRWIRNRIGIKI